MCQNISDGFWVFLVSNTRQAPTIHNTPHSSNLQSTLMHNCCTVDILSPIQSLPLSLLWNILWLSLCLTWYIQCDHTTQWWSLSCSSVYRLSHKAVHCARCHVNCNLLCGWRRRSTVQQLPLSIWQQPKKFIRNWTIWSRNSYRDWARWDLAHWDCCRAKKDQM